MDEMDVLVNDLIAAAGKPDARERVRHLVDSAFLEMVVRLNGVIDSLTNQNRRLTKRLGTRGG